MSLYKEPLRIALFSPSSALAGSGKLRSTAGENSNMWLPRGGVRLQKMMMMRLISKDKTRTTHQIMGGYYYFAKTSFYGGGSSCWLQEIASVFRNKYRYGVLSLSSRAGNALRRIIIKLIKRFNTS